MLRSRADKVSDLERLRGWYDENANCCKKCKSILTVQRTTIDTNLPKLNLKHKKYRNSYNLF